MTFTCPGQVLIKLHFCMIWWGGGGGCALPALVASCVSQVCRLPINIQQYLLDYCI
jgi:hypothetical protein